MRPFTPGEDPAAGVLDREFSADRLAGLREAVLSCATACGMPADRAADVMIAVHELAANAVRHGPGHGRLRIHRTASTLRCEVSDPGLASQNHRDPGGTGSRTPTAPGPVPWPVEHGHGLWLVHGAADNFRVSSGPRGSLATAEFTLPAALPPQGRPPGVTADGPGG